ncbi:MAG: hypothetical protein Q8M96_15585 [Rubrivivax sp.]|nr:hypothetical protein [Rubrivivax sp.]
MTVVKNAPVPKAIARGKTAAPLIGAKRPGDGPLSSSTSPVPDRAAMSTLLKVIVTSCVTPAISPRARIMSWSSGLLKLNSKSFQTVNETMSRPRTPKFPRVALPLPRARSTSAWNSDWKAGQGR